MIKVLTGVTMLAAATSASTPIAAGRWLVTNQMEGASFNGQADNGPFPTAEPQTVCLTSEAAARGPGLAFADPSRCKILSATVAAGAYSVQTRCTATESTDIITTQSRGRYTVDAYTGTSSSIQRRGGMRIEMRSRTEAKRIGDC